MQRIQEASSKNSAMFYIADGNRMLANTMFSSSFLPIEIQGKTFPHHICFGRLYVEPGSRNQGLAKRLLERSMEYLRQTGLPTLCDVNPYGDLGYDKLVELYTRYGFCMKLVKKNNVAYETLVFYEERNDAEA